MESSGFVERRSDPNDGRARRVYLTKAGHKLVTTIRESVEQVELGILNQIPENELDQAAETLLALKNTLLEMIEADDADDDRAEINIMN
jgi:DNA-binding MarR family transcriptional regulator